MYRRSAVSFALLLVAAACSGAQGGGPDAGAITTRVDATPAPDAPPAPEICDGTDNDLDGEIDEGTPIDLCGEVAQGDPRCNGLGGCALDACMPGFLDLDGVLATGCECAQEVEEAGAAGCAEVVPLGDLPDTDTERLVIGNLAPAGDVDVLRFRAVDTPDDACDRFHVRVRLVDNPDDAFRLEVLRGGCDGEPVAADGDATDVRWYVNHEGGQCPCAAPDTPDPKIAVCVDDSAEFVVRVVRAPGKPVGCAPYRLEITSGRYAAP